MPEKPVEITLKIKVVGEEKAKAVRKSVEDLGGKVKKVTKITEDSGKKMGYTLTFIAWHFRYLGNIFDKVGKQLMRVINDAIKTSAELQESFLSISTAAAIYGRSSEKATQLTRRLSLTGLMPLVEAANSVKNLMITGIGLPELEEFTYRYLDVAFLFTSGADEMSKSLEVMSKSILRGTLVLATDVTARKLWIDTEQRLQRTMGVSMKEISARQRAIELLRTIEEQYASTLGFHRIEMETTRAAMTKMNAAITILKDALGTALLPILNLVSDILVKLSGYITGLIKALGPTIPVVTALTLVISIFIGKISFLIGVILSFVKIASFFSISLWKIYLPLTIIGTALGLGTYLLLKHSGALDKAKDSATKMSAQLEKLREQFSGLSEETMEVDEDRKIAHERAVEDIMEDLERERSKGLWTNQMTIKDLEKRLKRENEDWQRYLKGKGQLEESGKKTSFGILDELMDKTNEVSENINKIDWWEGMKEKLKAIQNTITKEEFWTRVFTKLGSTFYNLGEYVWNEFLVYLTKPEFWRILGENIRAIGSFIWNVLEASLEGLSEAIANWIMGGTQKASENFLDLSDKLTSRAKELWEQGEYEKSQRLLEINKDLAADIGEMYSDLAEKLSPWKLLKGWGMILLRSQLGIPPFQFGGIVPGMRNQPVPIIAHGGERVIPAGEVTGGNFIVNINNPVVREQEDINRIARAVSEVLGRRNIHGRLGAY